jgi:starvation-inducible DNA-binding protein
MRSKGKAPKENQKAVVEGLNELLANTYSIYVKTQNFHWNVTGPLFKSLHTLLDHQYKELVDAIDVIAEHIRALQKPVPASFSEFSKLASIKDSIGKKKAEKMIQELVEGHEWLIEFIRKQIRLTEDQQDDASQDLLVDRLRAHLKNAWMLRSFLDKN